MWCSLVGDIGGKRATNMYTTSIVKIGKEILWYTTHGKKVVDYYLLIYYYSTRAIERGVCACQLTAQLKAGNLWTLLQRS